MEIFGLPPSWENACGDRTTSSMDKDSGISENRSSAVLHENVRRGMYPLYFIHAVPETHLPSRATAVPDQKQQEQKHELLSHRRRVPLEIEFVGTCFAVTPNIVVTTAHHYDTRSDDVGRFGVLMECPPTIEAHLRQQQEDDRWAHLVAKEKERTQRKLEKEKGAKAALLAAAGRRGARRQGRQEQSTQTISHKLKQTHQTIKTSSSGTTQVPSRKQSASDTPTPPPTVVFGNEKVFLLIPCRYGAKAPANMEWKGSMTEPQEHQFSLSESFVPRVSPDMAVFWLESPLPHVVLAPEHFSAASPVETMPVTTAYFQPPSVRFLVNAVGTHVRTEVQALFLRRNNEEESKRGLAEATVPTTPTPLVAHSVAQPNTIVLNDLTIGALANGECSIKTVVEGCTEHKNEINNSACASTNKETKGIREQNNEEKRSALSCKNEKLCGSTIESTPFTLFGRALKVNFGGAERCAAGHTHVLGSSSQLAASLLDENCHSSHPSTATCNDPSTTVAIYPPCITDCLLLATCKPRVSNLPAVVASSGKRGGNKTFQQQGMTSGSAAVAVMRAIVLSTRSNPIPDVALSRGEVIGGLACDGYLREAQGIYEKAKEIIVAAHEKKSKTVRGGRGKREREEESFGKEVKVVRERRSLEGNTNTAEFGAHVGQVTRSSFETQVLTKNHGDRKARESNARSKLRARDGFVMNLDDSDSGAFSLADSVDHGRQVNSGRDRVVPAAVKPPTGCATLGPPERSAHGRAHATKGLSLGRLGRASVFIENDDSFKAIERIKTSSLLPHEDLHGHASSWMSEASAQPLPYLCSLPPTLERGNGWHSPIGVWRSGLGPADEFNRHHHNDLYHCDHRHNYEYTSHATQAIHRDPFERVVPAAFNAPSPVLRTGVERGGGADRNGQDVSAALTSANIAEKERGECLLFDAESEVMTIHSDASNGEEDYVKAEKEEKKTQNASPSSFLFANLGMGNSPCVWWHSCLTRMENETPYGSSGGIVVDGLTGSRIIGMHVATNNLFTFYRYYRPKQERIMRALHLATKMSLTKQSADALADDAGLRQGQIESHTNEADTGRNILSQSSELINLHCDANDDIYITAPRLLLNPNVELVQMLVSAPPIVAAPPKGAIDSRIGEFVTSRTLVHALSQMQVHLNCKTTANVNTRYQCE